VTDGQSQDWGRLMAAVQSGDRGAYVRLLHAILPNVRQAVSRHHATPERVEASVQDVLRTLHRLRHTYDPARPFANWLMAISEHRARLR
jgi:RNA polymerase sigma-70 factor (ECF subfamily)